jgi:hypothetical protein
MKKIGMGNICTTHEREREREKYIHTCIMDKKVKLSL